MHQGSADRRLADNPLAIVGMSGLFPMANNHREYWQNIFEGADCTQEVPESRWKLDDYYDSDPTAQDKTYARRGAFLPDVDFDPLEFGLPPNQLGITSTMQTLSLGVARDLLRDAGAANSDWYDASRTGVVLGATCTVPLVHPLAARLSTPVLKEVVRSCGLSDQDANEIADKYVKAFAPWEENTFPGLLANVVAGRLANRLGLGGMNCTVDAACAASLAAIRTAAAELVDGRADMMITGGVDTECSIFMYMAFSKVGALSYSDRISPFSDAADGTLLGEGIGMIALRRLSDAERDGNRIYAVIRGMGASSDGRANSIYAPRAEGQRLALDRAYADADCSPSSVELFEAHATGTAVGDRTELSALRDLLRDAGNEPHVAALGSVKSQIGHTRAAAGTASLMKVALALQQKVLPGTINVDQPNKILLSADAPFYANVRTRPWILDPHRPVRRAGVSSMGFGGTNFHFVLEEHRTDRTGLRLLHRAPTAYLWHAPDRERLLELLRTQTPATDDGNIPAEHARIGFVAMDDDQTTELRELAIRLLADDSDTDEWSHPKGVYYRRHAAPDLCVGALFAGQGSQYLDMGAAAALNNPVVGTAFDTANGHFAETKTRLAQVVYPPAAFDNELRKSQEANLQRTEFAQPAIGALSVGQFGYLTELGLSCSAYAGHSFGELTALWAAGSLSYSDYFRLAAARGRAMAPVAEGDTGAMAAVQAGREWVTEIITEFPDVVICNHNTPDQVVVGGPTEDIKRFVRECGQRNIKARMLPVSAAFHTRYVAHAVEAFRPAVHAVGIGQPNVPVYANSPGKSYGEDSEANADILVRQLLEPVEFVSVLQQMRADGINVFVEFGPKQVLSQFVQQTLGKDARVIATDSGPLGNSDVTLKRAAVQLAVLGIPLSGINRYAEPPVERVAASSMAVSLSAPEYVPDERRATYQAALDNGYRVSATPIAQARPEPTDSSAQAAIVDCPTVGFATPAPAIPISATPVMSLEDSVPNPVDQYLTLHSRYLESQLNVVEQVASALKEPVDRNFLEAVNAVARQSEAISHTHARASEILATLVELESGHSTGDTFTVPAPTQVLAPTSLSIVGIESSVNPTPRLQALPDLTPQPTPAPAVIAQPQSRPQPVVNAQPTATAPPSSNSHANSDISAVIIKVISDKTGYPIEMIDRGLDLESDLGVDSIKRVQVMAAVQEQIPGLPPLGPEQLAELRTVDQVVAYLTKGGDVDPQPQSRPQPVVNAQPTATAPPSSNSHANSDISAVIIKVISDKTGYPIEMIDRGLDLESDLGVDSIKRVQVMAAVQEQIPGLPPLGPEQLAELRTVDQVVAYLTKGGDVDPKARRALASPLRHIVELVRLPKIDLVEQAYSVDPVAVMIDSGHADGDILAAELARRGWTVRRANDDADGLFNGRVDLCVRLIDAATDWEAAERQLVGTIMTAKTASAALDPTRTRAAFVAVTRLDGGLGLHGRLGAVPSLVGGASGVVKTLAQEKPGLFCRSVDVDPALSDAEFAAAVLDEIHDAAWDTLEVGVDSTGARWTVAPGLHGPAARTSAVGDELTGTGLLTNEDMLLVTGGARGVTAQCVRALAAHTSARFLLLGRTELGAEPGWAIGVSDADLKQAAITGLSSDGAFPKPRHVQRVCHDLIAQREIRDTLSALGGRATYLAADVSDATAVGAVLAQYRNQVTGLVHGAGVLADALLSDKTVTQIETVFRPKLDGLHNVIDMLDGPVLRHLVLFTSVAGLLGNSGQADYAAANEALCRFAAGWKYAHPGAHVTAIDWTAWNGGMVTDDLRELFAERDIALLGLDAGASAFVEQFTEPHADELRVLIGEDTTLSGSQLPLSPGFRTSRAIRDLVADPVIQAHRVGSHPVLPATFGLGWLVNVVERAHPGLCVVRVREFHVNKGIVFDDQPHYDNYQVEIEAGTRDGDRLQVRASVRGTSTNGRPTSFYTGMFVLATVPEQAAQIEIPRFDGAPTDAAGIYHEATLFHAPRLQGIRDVLYRSHSRLVLRCRLADADLAGRSYHGRLHSPVLADLLLQGPAVLGKDLLGGACLPLGIDQAEWFAPLPDDEPFIVIVDDVKPAPALFTSTATAIALDGTVLQRFAGITQVSTADMSEKFRESVRLWLPDQIEKDVHTS